MKQRRPDDVIRCSADADPMSKTIIGPMKLSIIGPMKHPSRARHRADEVVLVGTVFIQLIIQSGESQSVARSLLLYQSRARLENYERLRQ